MGVRVEAKPVDTDAGCDGCAGWKDVLLCKHLPNCTDGEHRIIWKARA